MAETKRLYRLTYPDTGSKGQPTGVIDVSLSERQAENVSKTVGRPGARLQSIEPAPDDEDTEG